MTGFRSLRLTDLENRTKQTNKQKKKKPLQTSNQSLIKFSWIENNSDNGSDGRNKPKTTIKVHVQAAFFSISNKWKNTQKF